MINQGNHDKPGPDLLAWDSHQTADFVSRR